MSPNIIGSEALFKKIHIFLKFTVIHWERPFYPRRIESTLKRVKFYQSGTNTAYDA